MMITTSVKLDAETFNAIREVMRATGIRSRSALIRASLLFTVLLNSDIPISKALKPEALRKIRRGEDLPVGQAIKPFSELIAEYTRIPHDKALFERVGKGGLNAHRS